MLIYKQNINMLNKTKKIISLSFISLTILFTSLPSFSNNNQEIVVKGCEPFEYITNKEKACLLIHGLGACPHEVSQLGEHLRKRGFSVYSIRYPGHGLKGKAMENYGWKDWYKEVEDKYLELKSTYKNVYVAGFSTGGTLTLKLAENHDVEKIALLSPFIKIAYKWYYIFSPEDYLNSFIGNMIDGLPSKYTATHLNDPVEKKNYVKGEFFSFKAVKSALELIKNVKENIKDVKAPTLLMHSINDETTDHYGSNYIYENISSKNKKLIKLTKSNHIITLDYEKRKVFREVEKFFKDN